MTGTGDFMYSQHDVESFWGELVERNFDLLRRHWSSLELMVRLCTSSVHFVSSWPIQYLSGGDLCAIVRSAFTLVRHQRVSDLNILRDTSQNQ